MRARACSAGIELSCDEVRCARPLGADVVGVHPLLYFAIRVSDALVLTQMLDPRFRHEALQETGGVLRILEYLPVVRAVALPDFPKGLYRLQKLAGLAGIDDVFDRDQDRSPLEVDVVACNGRGPMR